MATNKELLKALMTSYLYNLTFMPISDRCTITGQSILGLQLNEIASATDVNTKAIHDNFDSMACEIKSGKITFNNAANMIMSMPHFSE